MFELWNHEDTTLEESTRWDVDMQCVWIVSSVQQQSQTGKLEEAAQHDSGYENGGRFVQRGREMYWYGGLNGM